MSAHQAMPVAMLVAVLTSNGTQRNATQRTNRRLTHLDIKSSPSVTHTRVSKTGNLKVAGRAGFAQRSEVGG